MNHRLYRQSRKYYTSVKLQDTPSVALDGTPTNGVDVYVLRDTWMLDNAVKMARAAYEKAVKEEKKALGKQLARWHDFRINLNPSDGAGTVGAYTQVKSQLVNADSLQATILNTGDFSLSNARDESNNLGYNFGLWESGNQFNILKEYSEHASTSQSPTEVETNVPYGELDASDTSDTTFIELQQQGDMPPYDNDNMNDLQLWRHVGSLQYSPHGHKLSTGVFCAPLGVVMLVPHSRDVGAAAVQVCFDVKAGDYKGVYSEAMS